ncbi:septal ring lytic transglycosylase RlpA family protein [Thalassotalea aquiviva]|uniref:septal ring lytic transglycosylase RlpA family protein n=1 Tax=Thalassotalea aquiviva TaxID=3242415 RepID=UPI00352B49F9
MNNNTPFSLRSSLKTLCVLFVLSQMFGCTTSRYSQTHDSIPKRFPTSSELIEPLPKLEPKSPGGNKPYQVFGVNYQVLDSAQNYQETGVASWYGQKFHGHLTSNGEIYDMYGFSAAHKSLPLPTYVQVTNLDNNKKVIVRVNDRGPFHQDRLIDLSYSAAYKLGMLEQGTARVKVEAITASNIAQFKHLNNKGTEIDARTVALAARQLEPISGISNIKPLTAKEAVNTSANPAKYIHVIVTKDRHLAQSTAKALRFLMPVQVNLTEKNELYRVQLGPIDSMDETEVHLNHLKTQGYSEAYQTSALK